MGSDRPELNPDCVFLGETLNPLSPGFLPGETGIHKKYVVITLSIIRHMVGT